MESHTTRSVDGTKMGKLKLKELRGTIDDTLFQKTIKKISSMLEFLPKNKLMISKDRLNSSKRNTKSLLLSKILDQELILKEKGSKKSWTNCLTEKSKKLWLPQKIDLQDLDLICLKQYSVDLEQKLQQLNQKSINPQKRNSRKTSYPLSLYSPHGITDPESTKNVITRKIKIYPNKKQKEYFNSCFGATRYIYNKTIDYVDKSYQKDRETYKRLSKKGCVIEGCKNEIMDGQKFFCKSHKNRKLKYSYKVNLQSLREEVMPKERKVDWLEKIPYDTRQLIIKDFVGSYKSAISNKKNGNIDHFNFRFKSKKNPTQIFHIDKRAITKDLNLFKRRKIGKLRVRKRMKNWVNKNINKIECDCKIIRYNPDQYYLLLTQKKETQYEKPILNTVSLDPGVRSFQTFYSPDGVCGSIGDKFEVQLRKIAKRINELSSVKSKKKGRTKKNLNNRISLLRTKIKNKINDLHWKTTNFLCKTFHTIIIPEFGTKNMVKKGSRNIYKKTVKDLTNLSHYKFLTKLKYKCQSYSRNLLIVDEHYTSKTCGKCGSLNKTLGNAKTFVCDKCGLCMDRDINGARNILLKTTFS